MRKPSPPREVRSELSWLEKQLLCAYWLRNLSVFQAAQEIPLERKHFSARDGVFFFCWRTLEKFYADYQDLPNHDSFEAACEAMLETDPKSLTDAEIKTLNELVGYAYYEAEPQIATDESHGRQLLRQFLEDSVARTLSGSYQSVNGLVRPANFQDELRERLEELELAHSLANQEVPELFGPGWETRGLRPRAWQTGVQFMDQFLGGGHFGGGTFGLTAPTGSGKTTMAIQMTGHALWQQDMRIRQDPRRTLYPVYFASWEVQSKEFSYLLLCQLARISKNHWDKEGKIDDLPRTLQPWEEKEFEVELSQGHPVQSAYQRALYWVPRIRRGVIFLGYSGEEGREDKGHGGVEEIRSEILAHQRKYNLKRASLFVLDYVNAMVDRERVSKKTWDQPMNQWIDRVPLVVRNRIGLPLNCPCWMLQQSTGENNRRSPGAMLSVTDGEGSKTFHKNNYYGFSIGTLCKERNPYMAKIACVKARNNKPSCLEVIAALDGEFVRWLPTHGKYVAQGTRIVPAQEAREVATGDDLEDKLNGLKQRQNLYRNYGSKTT